ncbi:nuclear pore complex protein Nup107-like [Saccostrea cucullata]|uniref:nuclear pore complex protein Nup107-like n=1 Tax=Saccostrea cuccullata TaxID=36930 RepID=UPI002ED5158E
MARRSFLADTSANAADASLSFTGGVRAQIDGSSFLRGDDRQRVKDRRSLNIQKSLQILDESVSSPTPRSRTGGLRRASYAPKSLTPSSKYDTSVQFTPNTAHQLSQNESQFGRQFAGSTMYGQSMLSALAKDVTEEITTTNVALLLEEDPGISACRGMYRDFLQCMKGLPSETQVFDLLNEYERVCQEQVTLLYKLVNRAASRSEPKYQKTFNMLHMLEMEKHTWQLIKSLFHDRLEKELEEMQMAMDEMNPLTLMKQSEQEAVTRLFEKDRTIRESQLVIDWLEKCAQDVVENYGDNAKFFSDRAVAWENTLHKLKKSGGVTFGNERPMVTEMDPDAPFRQKKMLDDLDQEDECRLLQYLFICLRAGQIDKAQEVCKSHGQAWRAATLEGWKLYHDPNFEGPNGQIDPVVGNPHRVIWKCMCWAMAADPKYDVYERSIYGALSGNLRAMLSVCKSWLDHVWAHYKVLVDLRAETEIRTMCSVDTSMDVPSEYWDQPSDPETIFHRIEAIESIRRESQDFYHIIQKWVILGDVEKLLDLMAQWIRGQEKTLPQHLIRFMAHVVLFIRCTQHRVNEDNCNAVLEAYVRYLIEDDHKELVSHYVSKLPPKAQVHWYARFLEGITNVEEKQMCLQLAEEVNLDIPQITKTVVENIRNKSGAGLPGATDVSLDVTVTEEDKKKIAAIDWLVFDSAQRAEAVKQANAVMRTFIAVKKLAAAREVFDKLPVDSIDIIYRNWHIQTGNDDLPVEDENAIREYLCIKSYLDAMDSFNEWFTKFHHTKPVKPMAPHAASFTEKVAFEHRLKQYEQELERWQRGLLAQTENTTKLMYNVLLFADGGWMVDQKECDSDPGRKQQMESLRQLILPQLCFLLHDILHKTEQYPECLQLADHIASEQHALYKVFRQDELQHLLHLFRESSLAVLDQNKDPLGYEID